MIVNPLQYISFVPKNKLQDGLSTKCILLQNEILTLSFNLCKIFNEIQFKNKNY